MRKKKNPVPLILMAAGSLLFLGAIVSLVVPGIFTPQATPTPLPAADSVESVPRISLEDALAAYQAGSALFLDVRDAQSYASRHVPGALSIPIEQLPDRIAELDPQTWIITY
jgi:hypothetical protein